MSLVSPATFEELFNSVRLSQKQEAEQILSRESQSPPSRNCKRPFRSRLQALRRLMPWHWPSNEGLIQIDSWGAHLPSGCPGVSNEILGPECEKRVIDVDAARKLLEVFCNRD